MRLEYEIVLHIVEVDEGDGGEVALILAKVLVEVEIEKALIDHPYFLHLLP